MTLIPFHRDFGAKTIAVMFGVTEVMVCHLRKEMIVIRLHFVLEHLIQCQANGYNLMPKINQVKK